MYCPKCKKPLFELDKCRYCDWVKPEEIQPTGIYCYKCGKLIPQDSSFCTSCGAKQKGQQSSASKIVVGILFSLLVFMLLLGFVIVPLWKESHPESNNAPDPKPAVIATITKQHTEVTTKTITEEPTEITEPITEQQNQLIYNENDVMIYYKGLTKKNKRTCIDLLIENNSNKDLTVQLDDFSVNDFMINPIFSCDVNAGKKVNDDITIYDRKLEESNITNIEKVEFYFHFFNSADWKDKVDSNTITISFGE